MTLETNKVDGALSIIRWHEHKTGGDITRVTCCLPPSVRRGYGRAFVNRYPIPGTARM